MNRSRNLAIAGLTVLSLAAASPLLAVERAALAARAVAVQPVAFEVYIPVQHRALLERDLAALHDSSSPQYHQWMTPAQTSARFGATPSQIAAMQSQLAGFGLQSTLVNGHHLHVTGTVASAEQALGTTLKNGTFANGKKVTAATGRINVPSALAAVNAVVVGLSDKVRMQSHAHVVPLGVQPNNRYSTTGGYWFTDLKQAYKFPSYTAYNGTGVTIATLVDGAYSQADMNKYFAHEGIASPQFSEVNVDGGAPFNADSFETNLDFQQAGGIAPGASIIHYNIPDLSDGSIIDGLSQIIVDNKADIVSISLGGAEIYYTPGDNDGVDETYILKLQDDIFALGNLQGITFVASSGDAGALTAPPVACFPAKAGDPYPPHCGKVRASVEFPASSPHVTGVGGTNLVTSYDGGKTRNSAYLGEEAYADPLQGDIFDGTSATGSYWGSGGGTSLIFAKPLYQILAGTGSSKFRTVPDLAGHMGGCPSFVAGACNPADSFVYEVYKNLYYGAIGTSASAPDFAGLVALTEQSFGNVRLGNINAYIYTLGLSQSLGVATGVYNDGIPGYNGKFFTSGGGYNRVLGNGTVNGVNFMLAPATPVAGVPLTPTNP